MESLLPTDPEVTGHGAMVDPQQQVQDFQGGLGSGWCLGRQGRAGGMLLVQGWVEHSGGGQSGFKWTDKALAALRWACP